MNRFDYPFTRIISEPRMINNIRGLDTQEICEAISKDKTIHKVKSLKHFYPDSEGKPIFGFGENIWLVLDQVNPNHINIIVIQRDNLLYALYAFIFISILLNLFFPVLRPFAIVFFFFGFAIMGLHYISRKIGDSRLRSKLSQLEVLIKGN